MLIAALILIVIAMLSYLWLMIEGFKQHVLWGIGIFFIPLVSIIFAIMHWQKAKTPFLINLASSILIVVIMFQPFKAIMIESVEIGQRVQSGEITEQQGQDLMQQRMLQIFRGQDSAQSDDDLMTPEEEQIAALREELRVKNEAALASQAYAEEQAKKKTTTTEEKLREVQVFKPIKISQARNYIGKRLRIVSFEGVERQGILRSAGFSRLTLDRKLAGGQFNFDVLTKDIKTLEVQETVLK